MRGKQLQYALKKLGVYSSSVDGLWGNGTSTAFTNYIKINDLKASSGEDVFASVLSKVDVPTAFAAPKRKIVKKTPVQNNRTKDTAAIDYTFLGLNMLASSMGLIYSIYFKVIPMIVANTSAGLFSISLTSMKYVNRLKENDSKSNISEAPIV